MRSTLIPAALIATAVLAPGADAQTMPPGLSPVIPDATLLEVSATGRVSRAPDVATIRAGVVTQAPTAAAAVSENAARMARVISTLKRAGVADRDLTTSNLSLSPQYRYGENQPPVVTGYQVSNGVSIRFRDVAKSGTILDALVAEGANQIDGPSLSLDRPDAALDEARQDAIRRARARAALYAAAAGLRVDRIVSIDENGEDAAGPPQPMYRARMAVAESAPTQLLAGETDVTVTVSVRFLLR